MAEITLSNGAIARVDEADLAALSPYRWSWNRGYASSWVWTGGKSRTVLMHRVLMGEPEGLHIDHVNGDKLDNRRCNLRLVTHSQNLQNQRLPRSDSSTKVRGVERIGSGGYRARIWLLGRAIPLGCYRTIEEAAYAAAEGRRRYFTHAPECEVQL